MKKLIFLLLILLTQTLAYSSVTLDSTDDNIHCGTTDILTENGAVTASAWINPTVDTIGGGDPRIISRERVAGDGWYFAITATKAIYLEVSGGTRRQSVNNTLTFNTWQNVAVKYDGGTTGTNIHIFLNGVEVSYASAANGSGAVDNSGTTTCIGCRSPDNTRPLSGQISNVAIWSGTQLSDADILKQATGGKWAPLYVTTAPSRFWPMAEKSSSTSADGGTLSDLMGVANCTADNGANNTGMTWEYENFLQKGNFYFR